MATIEGGIEDYYEKKVLYEFDTWCTINHYESYMDWKYSPDDRTTKIAIKNSTRYRLIAKWRRID